MLDFSFLPFFASLEAAKSGMELPIIADARLSTNFPTVVLDPKETYRQITNVANGIAVLPIIKLELVDCADRVVANISSRVGIIEFQHDYNGTPQLAFEIAPLGLEAGGRLRFIRITSQAEVWYSTACVTSARYSQSSCLLDYWNTRTFANISYFNSNALRQRIRIAGLVHSGDATTGEVSSYTQYSNDRLQGIEVSANATLVPQYSYDIQLMPRFSWRRLRQVLQHDNIYINAIRLSAKTALPGGKFEGSTPAINAEFTASINESDTFDGNGFYIIPALALTSRSPIGTYTPDSVPNSIQGIFNYPVSLSSGSVIMLYQGSTLLNTYTADDITLDGNSFSVSIPDLGVGAYSWTISAGAFDSGIFGLSNFESTAFEVLDGEFDPEEFYNNEFLVA